MDQLVLTRVVRLEGRDIRGRHSVLTIAPNHRKSGWVWDVGRKEIPITPKIMVSLPRRVALRHGKDTLYDFEHIGILRAAGLHHARISCSSERPPYDAGSFALWQACMPHVEMAGELEPFGFGRDATSVLPEQPHRYSVYRYDTNNKKMLRLTGVVHFPEIAARDHRFGHEYPRQDILPLVRSRTLGWPPRMRFAALAVDKSRPLLRLFGREWPHYKRILWPYQAAPTEILEEVGRHRLLDALGILNFAAPDGTYLTGAFHSCMGNHATELGVTKQLYACSAIK
jgi:hypothetical protein